jgi:hypothetical protein
MRPATEYANDWLYHNAIGASSKPAAASTCSHYCIVIGANAQFAVNSYPPSYRFDTIWRYAKYYGIKDNTDQLKTLSGDMQPICDHLITHTDLRIFNSNIPTHTTNGVGSAGTGPAAGIGMPERFTGMTRHGAGETDTAGTKTAGTKTAGTKRTRPKRTPKRHRSKRTPKRRRSKRTPKRTRNQRRARRSTKRT